jgi:uncharacterized protein YodC (DUF2158 family)
MATESYFDIGDEVEHRTGGPKMIYTGKSQLGEAICEWFDGRQRHQESFSFTALKKFVQPSHSGPSIRVI